MLGSIYIGLSGLNAYSRGLQEVSNNVTNMNTSGFKGSTVTFQNYFGTADSGGLGYTVDTSASGNGVGMGDTLLDLKQGELRQTERDLDLAVDGTGFLVLLNGDETLYTRTGSFEIDKDGFLVLSGTEYRLATLDSSNRPVSLSVDSKRTNPPQATSTIKFSDVLSRDGTAHSISDVKVYDSGGSLHVWKVDLTKAASGNNWSVSITDGNGASVGGGEIKFMLSGAIDPTTRTLAIQNQNLSVTLDFSEVQGSGGGLSSSLKAAPVDGHGVGSLQSVTVNAKGEVELKYSNEQKVLLGAVALADFRDPQGLEQRSGGIFAFEGSGKRELMTSEDPRVGKVMSKRIEASNVDLSKQFGDLILIQRGFQASSQVISISNDMIQQLFGIRGQG